MQDTFTTRDLGLAATLVCLKYALLGVDYQVEGDKNRPIGYFKFENVPEISEVEMRYWRGQLAVEPRTFITNMRGLKAQVSTVYKKPNSSFESEKVI